MTRKLALSLALLCGMACAKAQNSEKYLGADISMLTAYETISEAGHQVTYKDVDGTQSDVLSLLRKYGMNSMRVRRNATFGSPSAVAVFAPRQRRAPLMSTPM